MDSNDNLLQYDPSLIEWSRTICEEKGRYIGWPTVTVRKNGEVLAVFSGDREGHICPFGKVQLVRSSDEGETWSEPVTIANSIIDDRDAGIIELPNGELLVTWFTSVAYAAQPAWKEEMEKYPESVRNATVGYFQIRSKDGGKTWSEPVRLENIDQTPHGPILLNDGSLFHLGRTDRKNGIYGNGACRFEETVITASRSTDGGYTWEMICKEIPRDPADNITGFHEPHVAELSDGTLVGLIRYGGKDGDGHMRITFSHDGGYTWTQMSRTTLDGHPPFLTVLDDGRLLCVYAHRAGDSNRGEIAAFSYDGGETWPQKIMLKRENIFDVGYPSTCFLKSGKMLTVYYGREEAYDKDGVTPLKNSLWATKWHLPKKPISLANPPKMPT